MGKGSALSRKARSMAGPSFISTSLASLRYQAGCGTGGTRGMWGNVEGGRRGRVEGRRDKGPAAGGGASGWRDESRLRAHLHAQLQRLAGRRLPAGRLGFAVAGRVAAGQVKLQPRQRRRRRLALGARRGGLQPRGLCCILVVLLVQGPAHAPAALAP